VRQALVPGQTIDVLTPGEAAELFESIFRETVQERVRAAGTIQLDATGAGTEELYTVPLGFEFEVRRLFVDISTAADPNTNSVALNVAGRSIEILRSGTRVEYAAPLSPNGGIAQVPGVQSWGDEQGPYFRNGEVVELRCRGLTAQATLDATVEGILRRPPASRDHGRGR
jgi:hypothetical protein